MMTTYSLNNAITDSAAAATALATGHKVNNLVVSQSSTGQPYQTILEFASAMGKKTGLVTTDPITRATPAAFGAHDPSRYNYLDIGDDYLNQTRPDVLFGGGSTSSNGSEFWSKSQTTQATGLGYSVVYNNTELQQLNSTNTQKALGLFSLKEMPYEYDGYPLGMPHLSQMSTAALDLLSADNNGFFLMIEGAKIDWASHANDIARTTMEVVEFNNTAQAMIDWVLGRDDTLLLITGDHETGGLKALNRGKGKFAKATWTSTDHTAANLPVYAIGKDSALVDSYITNGIIDNTQVFSIMRDSFETPVPEPSSIVTLLLGIAGTGVFVIRKRR